MQTQTFVTGRVLLEDGQRGAHGGLAEGVTPTLFDLGWHFYLGEGLIKEIKMVSY